MRGNTPRHRPSRSRRALSLGLVALAVVMLAGPVAALSPAIASGTGARSGGTGEMPLAPAASPPAASGYNPPCYPIATTICLSMANSSQPNILPPFGSYVATTQPNPTKNIDLFVKSRLPLNYSKNNPMAGPSAVMQLNVTGTLWNGDPYYSSYSGNIWHADNVTDYWWWSGHTVANTSYPYWYDLEFDAVGTLGTPNFFAGMHVTWWVAFYTYNNSHLTHWTSPDFQFTYSGAWPYSPYPGAVQFAGSSAPEEDVAISLSPQAPNWNDSVTATINTTASDGAPVNASIGRAYWIVEEYGPNGTVLNSATLTFPGSPATSNTLGAPGESTTSIALPAGWAQIEGSTVRFNFVVYDTFDDRIATAEQSYTVGGNGSFSTGIFADDLSLSVAPTAILVSSNATVAPGVAVPVTLSSEEPGTSLLAAQLFVSFSYPALGETATTVVPLTRERSTLFTGSIQPFPIGSQIAFSVEAWDFAQHEDLSSVFSYSVPTLSELIPTIPGNSTFFYVYVYDNGTQSWVSNAHVQISGVSNSVGLEMLTSYGVAYPNVSGLPLVPVLIPANSSYRISVLDSAWVPPAPLASGNLTITVLLGHTVGARGPIAVGPDYWVVQEGDAFMFYLNATPPAVVASPPASTGGSLELAATLGLVGAGLLAIPLVLWWRRVRARRAAEERRVTL